MSVITHLPNIIWTEAASPAVTEEIKIREDGIWGGKRSDNKFQWDNISREGGGREKGGITREQGRARGGNDGRDEAGDKKRTQNCWEVKFSGCLHHIIQEFR